MRKHLYKLLGLGSIGLTIFLALFVASVQMSAGFSISGPQTPQSNGGTGTTTPFAAGYTIAAGSGSLVTEPVLYANQFTGSDIGAQVNAAYAALPSGGGEVINPAGSYTFATPITFTTAGKFGLLKCESGAILTWNGNSTSTAITFDDGNSSPNQYNSRSYGGDGCTLIGPGSVLTTNASTTGVTVGGTNYDQGLVVNAFTIKNFGVDYSISSATWVTDLSNSNVSGANPNIQISGTYDVGENISFDNLTCYGAASSTQPAITSVGNGYASVTFNHPSFDDCPVNVNNGTYSFVINGGHAENPGWNSENPFNYFTIGNNAGNVLTFNGFTMMNDASSATGTPSCFIKDGGNLDINGMTVDKNGNQAATSLICDSGSSPHASFTARGIVLINSPVTNYYGSTAHPGPGDGQADQISDVQNSWMAGWEHNANNTYSFYNGGVSTPNLTFSNTSQTGINGVTPNAAFDIQSGTLGQKYLIAGLGVASSTIATSTDSIFGVSTTTIASGVTLPNCTSTTDRMQFTVKDIGGNASTSNITVYGGGSNIEGAATKLINTNYGSVKFECIYNGGSVAKWFTIP